MESSATSEASLSEIAALLTEAEAGAKAGANQPAPLSRINTWAQVGRVAEPGRYIFRFGWLKITAEDLAVWWQDPNAVFTLYGGGDGRSREEFRLGTFELRESISLSEK
jgi:hypothetical protein